MDSREFSETRQRLMVFRALLTNDLESVITSWGLRIWAVLAALLALITMLSGMSESTASEALASVLGMYPLIWSTFAIMLSAGAVSSEAGVVADSILSKAVTRYDYILAKLLSRILTVLAVYLLVAVPSAYFAFRYSENVLTTEGLVWGVVLIGATMVLLTSIAVSFSTLFNWTLVAVMGAWFLWYAAGGIFALLEIEQMSPLHLVDQLPLMLQGDFSGVHRWQTLIVFSTMSALVSGLSILHFARKDL